MGGSRTGTRARDGGLVAIIAIAILGMLLLLAVWPRDAAADPISCGATITGDTTLSADLSCTGTALRIGADGVDLDLNGHRVESVCTEADCSASIGIDNSAGYDRVRISNGAVDGVQYGVLLIDASYNRLLRLDAFAGSYGRVGSSAVRLEGSSRNTIADSELDGGDPGLQLLRSSRNVIVRNSITGGVGIRWGGGVWIADGSSRNRLRSNGIGGFGRGVDVSDSNGNLLTRNVVSNVDDVIAVDRSARTRIARNELWTAWGKCIRASDVTRSVIVANRDCPILISGDRNLVARNKSRSQSIFTVVALTVAGGDRNVIRENPTYRNCGYDHPAIIVRAAATRTLLDRNAAIGCGSDMPVAEADGIRIEAPGTIVRRNVAIDNQDLGIDAIDGGGNRAGGNLNPLQCVNVACAPVGPDIPAARAARRARSPR